MIDGAITLIGEFDESSAPINNSNCVIGKCNRASAVKRIVSGYAANLFTRVQARLKKSSWERIQSDRHRMIDIACW